ncbi:RNA polymerase subunit sigma-70 [Bacillus sp. FJAT-49736]|uniref:RNA polymerase subunit sigma-70 n=1 Tax=Bacillus sp. FJAT-49736 TaxID=2833582 RepID=UPI001BC900EB|nr:RNA polymerase subunit sigma-70 [Bacillus sp. FJAT-49736]MBS4173658.1 RNA polymerase subunit sigma-70 [Bacillus sp. FJAT-49736]
MRLSNKNQLSNAGSSQIFQTDLHHFMEREDQALSIELASEFGLSLGEVKLLKKKMERS